MPIGTICVCPAGRAWARGHRGHNLAAVTVISCSLPSCHLAGQTRFRPLTSTVENSPGINSGAHQPGAVTHPNGKMRDAPAVQVAHHARVRDEGVRQHHQIDGGASDRGMRLAAVRDPGARAAQCLYEQVRQRSAAVHPDRCGPAAGLSAPTASDTQKPTFAP